MANLTLHDFAKDVAAAVEREHAGPAIIAGHAYGHYVAKMVAVDFPEIVRGVALVTATQKNLDPELVNMVTIATDAKRDAGERLKYLRMLFFAPGHDARIFLDGFDAAVEKSQRAARVATPAAEYWAAGAVPFLDLQGESDPFRPPATQYELLNEFGAARVTVVRVPGTSHALPLEDPRAAANAIVAFAAKIGHKRIDPGK